jgi:hypothetical protein
MEPCATPACISPGVDSSASTITLNFLLERNELVSPIKLDEKCSLGTLYNKPVCYVLSNSFTISKKIAAVDVIVIEVESYVVRKLHALKRHSVTYTKSKLARI